MYIHTCLIPQLKHRMLKELLNGWHDVALHVNLVHLVSSDADEPYSLVAHPDILGSGEGREGESEKEKG